LIVAGSVLYYQLCGHNPHRYYLYLTIPPLFCHVLVRGHIFLWSCYIWVSTLTYRHHRVHMLAQGAQQALAQKSGCARDNTASCAGGVSRGGGAEDSPGGWQWIPRAADYVPRTAEWIPRTPDSVPRTAKWIHGIPRRISSTTDWVP
jgi:hypothetical protein